MRHRNSVSTIHGALRGGMTGLRARRWRGTTFVLLLCAVVTGLSGCVLVPVGGWDDEHEHGHWHDGHGYYHGEHYSYRG